MLRLGKVPAPDCEQSTLNVSTDPCRPFWRCLPVLTRNLSLEKSPGRLSRPGTATLRFTAASRAREMILKIFSRLSSGLCSKADGTNWDRDRKPTCPEWRYIGPRIVELRRAT